MAGTSLALWVSEGAPSILRTWLHQLSSQTKTGLPAREEGEKGDAECEKQGAGTAVTKLSSLLKANASHL